MKTSSSKQIPVVLVDMHSNDGLLPFIVSEARKENWRFFDVGLTKGTIPSDLYIIGAISGQPSTHRPYSNLLSESTPVIRTATYHVPEETTYPTVMSDKRALGALAADHFVDQGFKHVCYIGHTPWANPPVAYEGFKERSEAHGCEVHLRRFTSFNEAHNQGAIREDRNQLREDELKRWLQELPKPIGILAYSHRLAAMLDVSCKSLDISVPGEVNIINAIETPQCNFCYTPISSIDIDCPAIARAAVTSLRLLIEGKSLPAFCQRIPPAGVIRRQSTDTMAISHPLIAKAMAYIIRRIDWPITTEDIASHIGIPRRRLSRLFKQCIGHSINEDIRQRRLSRACELLSTTDISIEQITMTIGFSSKTYFHKIFLENYGITPHNYREHHSDKS